MRQKGFSAVITLEGVKHIRLILVCAWCPKETHTPLKKHEEYTHGICEPHRRELTNQLKFRKQESDAYFKHS